MLLYEKRGERSSYIPSFPSGVRYIANKSDGYAYVTRFV